VNQSSRWIYVVFALGAAAVLGALALVTSHVLRLERREHERQAAAKADESIRLALWRMDSAVNAIIAKEAARPYFEYQPFFAADRAYTKMFEDVRPGEVLVPSPLLFGTGDYIRLHFQQLPDGTLASPQVPTGNMRDLAESAYVDSTAVIAAEDHLRHLAALIVRSDHADDTPLSAGPRQAPVRAGESSVPAGPKLEDAVEPRVPSHDRLATQEVWRALQPDDQPQSLREYEARSQSAGLAASNVSPSRGAPPQRTLAAKTEDAEKTKDPTVEPHHDDPRVLRQAVSETRAAIDRHDEAADMSAATAPADQAAKKSEETILAGAPVVAPSALPSTTTASPTAGDAAYRSIDGAIPPPESKRKAKQGLPPIFGLAYQPEPAVELSPFTPAWVGESPGELVFRRTIHTASATLEQGLWIDWPRLAAFLQTSASDLVPGATILPVSTITIPDATSLGRRLASIPAELRWTPPALATLSRWTPARTTLLLTWLATLVAIAAIAFVLHASTDLAERRGRFVSAVTHELRTPLTTFVMYSEMLADGMVTSEDARREYLNTLKSEASRLSRIVESVLDYARLGRKKKSAPPAPIAATDLLAQVEPALRRRAEQASIQLLVSSPDPSASATAAVRADPATVERILYNLVDNACKYAGNPPSRPPSEATPSTPDARIHLSLALTSRHAVFSVRDEGPGIPEHERANIFKPFHRGTNHSDGSIPGLGLGLALARGLAHSLAGSLDLAPTTVGTQIDLVLPRSDSARRT
jgi:signal transduction histidine kinase